MTSKRTKPQPPAASPPLIGLHNWMGHTKEGARWEVAKGDVVDALKTYKPDRFQCAVTSPPYFWQRDYKVAGQIGLEKTIDGYVENVVAAMEAVKRVLRKDGVLFLNLGDTYYSAKGMPRGDDRKNKARRFGLRAVDGPGLGAPRKTILGLPWRVALAMVAKGWILRSPIIWERRNSLPEPTAKDRPWRRYEFVFLFAKHQRYFFSRDHLGEEEDIWRLPIRTNAKNGHHSATFPKALAEKCILCGTRPDDEVLDPFAGSGSTIFAALDNKRNAVGVDLKQEYCDQMVQKLSKL